MEMIYFRLFYSNKKLLFVAILLTFFAGFGKTFLFSLYIPDMIQEFQLSTTGFALIYSVATITSGILVFYLGKLIDQTKIFTYTLWVAIGLVISCCLLSFSYNLVFLFIAVLGMRLSGQGLMNHTSLTIISQRFKRCRGKALSLAIIGTPLGEAILPLVVAWGVHHYGWRPAIFYSSMVLALVLIPAIFLLKQKNKVFEKFPGTKPKVKPQLSNKKWTIKKLFKDQRFYIVAFPVFLLAFLVTTLMFFLVPIAKSKNCSPELIAFAFPFFASGNFISTFFTGNILDKISSTKIFPYFLWPFAMCIITLLYINHPYAIFAAMFFAGVSVGSGITLESCIIAEIYGLKSLANLKSVFTSVNILSTAIGPLITGILLDIGITFHLIFSVLILLIGLASLLSFKLQDEKIQLSFSKFAPIKTVKKLLIHK
ncbi:major facilitator superfamily protein [Sporocytophaga myxococcoides]|uniref:Major facilitator superfamily protein n=1 Tax=Sporocytophaga myxococcoides TaxID=153721 RepID=A0A098LAP9_9BACT|nr:MFS transporter [Sporocytophaga myxococcoides]GAL83522.1 major facilitator superfamily protein [Sporocytophaga myxococcoides]